MLIFQLFFSYSPKVALEAIEDQSEMMLWYFHALVQVATAADAKLRQSCLTLCDLIDGSPTGSSVPGSLQARILEWVAITFSSAWKWKVKVKSLSRVWLLVTPWTVAYQASPSMGFSRPEYWRGLPLPSLSTGWVPLYFKLHRKGLGHFGDAEKSAS